MNHQPVSIVIPNFNGELFIGRSLLKVFESVQNHPDLVEVIVVDDASQDDSVSLISQSFPDTKIICHSENRGFSEAVMTGVLHSSHEIIILLNSDVYPDRGFIAPLMKWFDREDTFSVSPIIYDPKGTPMRVSWNIIRFSRGDMRSQGWRPDQAFRASKEGKPLLSLFASGGSIAFRKDMFMKLHGFLPIYKPFYYEDRDLCMRAWKKGWKTYFEPGSMVTHDHRSTINRFFSSLKIRSVRRRNRFIYLWLHLSVRTIVLKHIPWVIPRLMGRIIRFDLPFIIGFSSAVSSVKTIARIRSQWQREGDTACLEELLNELEKNRRNQ
jgi:GT2 family glycosyltransferase